MEKSANQYTVVLTDKAISDITEAKKWYANQQENLGKRFADAVLDCIDAISKYPNAYPNKYKYTREAVVQKFPYVVVYSIEESIIFILRVFATKQNPAKKHASKND